MNKKIKKFDDTEIENCNFHQHKRPISIDNIDFNKIVVSNKIIRSLLIKRILNTLWAVKMLKKLDIYAYFFQK